MIENHVLERYRDSIQCAKRAMKILSENGCTAITDVTADREGGFIITFTSGKGKVSNRHKLWKAVSGTLFARAIEMKAV